VAFTDNVKDRSNSSGYQFEFVCERCCNGYRSKFRPSTAGIGSKVSAGLTGLFGKKFKAIGTGAGSLLDDLASSKVKDKALQEAAAEIGPMFGQCPKCGNWVCHDVCWNEAAGLCVDDAPKSGEVAEAQVAPVAPLASAATVPCSNCGAAVASSAKFCPECGTPLKATVTCPSCSAEVPRASKFCPECGHKMA
jgi:hypothetical protein